jgi:hypothetical protein
MSEEGTKIDWTKYVHMRVCIASIGLCNTVTRDCKKRLKIIVVFPLLSYEYCQGGIPTQFDSRINTIWTTDTFK